MLNKESLKDKVGKEKPLKEELLNKFIKEEKFKERLVKEELFKEVSSKLHKEEPTKIHLRCISNTRSHSIGK